MEQEEQEMGIMEPKETINARGGVYQCNVRIDHLTHEKLKHIKDYYSQCLKLNVNNGAILRRALALLTDFLDSSAMKERQSGKLEFPRTQTKIIEEQILRKCSGGQYSKQLEKPPGSMIFATFDELRPKAVREPEEMRSLND